MQSLKQQVQHAVQDSMLQALEDQSYRTYAGRHHQQLKDMLCELFLGSHILLTNSGTSALELALRAIGVQPGDEVILSAYDYPGNFWVIEQLGCIPVLVDVLCDSTKLNLEELNRAISSKTKACIVSHLHGQLQEMNWLRPWADQHKLPLIEDGCQALGASICDHMVGNWGHLGIISFSGSKVISGGRGGALVTADERLFQRAKIAAGAGSGAYGLGELAAAAVLAQIPFLQAINRQVSQYFSAVLESMDPQAPCACLVPPQSTAALYQAGWVVRDDKTCTGILEQLQKIGVPAGAGFSGFHRRSPRRCRTTSRLQQTARLIDRLLLLHHSIAIDGKFSPQQLATQISSITG